MASTIKGVAPLGPTATSTPAHPRQTMTDGQLASPMSDTSDMSTDMKENMSNGLTINNMHSPISPYSGTTSGYKSDTSTDSRYRDRSRISSSDVFIDEEYPDRKEKLSPIQNFMQYRSPSPTSTVSRTSTRATRDSASSRADYGKFYTTSYLEKEGEVLKKGPPLNPKEPHSSHFHRPDNFSYSQVKKDYMRPLKKGMMSALGDAETITKRKLGQPYIDRMSKDEAIRMSKFPDAHKRDVNKPAPIERDDWPAPPEPAAAFPELFKKHRRKSRGKSRSSTGELGGGDADTTDGGFTTDEEKELSEAPPVVDDFSDEDDDDEERIPVDPRIEKEIAELTKIDAKSGAAHALLKELEKKKAEVPKLDPRSASRTPAANLEPPYKTRYESSIFASPSRDLDMRPRLYSLDDQLMERKYRTSTLPSSNFPVPRPGYGLASKTARLPGRDGYMSMDEYESTNRRYMRNGTMDYTTDEEGAMTDGGIIDRPRGHPGAHTKFVSQSDTEDLIDPRTGLRRRSRARGSAFSDHLRSPMYGKHSPRNEPAKTYDYNELKITNDVTLPDVDQNHLERHLSPEQFRALFNMSPTEFYRMAEWKRNDMKSRVELF